MIRKLGSSSRPLLRDRFGARMLERLPPACIGSSGFEGEHLDSAGGYLHAVNGKGG